MPGYHVIATSREATPYATVLCTRSRAPLFREGVSLLYQIDIRKRVAYTPNPSGYYYWSSVYYYDSDDFASVAAMVSRARDVDRLHSLDLVEYQSAIVKQPPGRANVVSTVPLTGNNGLIPSGGADYTLLAVARIRTQFYDGTWSYRYWRAPLLYSWFDPSGFSAYAQARMASYINNMSNGSGGRRVRNLAGSQMLLGVSPLHPSMWQLRHGTQRRERIYA